MKTPWSNTQLERETFAAVANPSTETSSHQHLTAETSTVAATSPEYLDFAKTAGHHYATAETSTTSAIAVAAAAPHERSAPQNLGIEPQTNLQSQVVLLRSAATNIAASNESNQIKARMEVNKLASSS